MKRIIEIYDGKKYFLKEYLPVLFMFTYLIGYFIYTSVTIRNYEDVYLSTAFDEKVIDVFEQRGDVYLLVTNKNNRYKIERSRNYDYTPTYLRAFLKENDRVIKNKGSDTIYIKRNLKTYHFIIGNMQYNNKEKPKKSIILN